MKGASKIDSTIRYGKINDRVYLIDLDTKDIPIITEYLDKLAVKGKFSKILAKVPEHAQDIFIDSGYVIEGILPKYYNGKETCLFMAKFLTQERKSVKDPKELDRVLNIAKSKKNKKEVFPLEKNMLLRKLTPEDSLEMSKVYKQVFQTYPYPVTKPQFLEKIMQENFIYYGIFDDKKLFAISSSETNKKYLNSEMTDFAVIPEYRGKSYSLILLDRMEKDLKELGYKKVYTLARSVSYGMNSIVSKMGYVFGGTLVNNTNIGQSIENMNLWYKIIE